jgi:tRNA 2-thiouridine synthesizing protein B
MLHLIFQSPLKKETLQRIGKADAVLFLENATLQLLKNGVNHPNLNNLLASNPLFVLVSDMEMRGIDVAELIEGITVIDYAEWVALTTQYHPIQSWY